MKGYFILQLAVLLSLGSSLLSIQAFSRRRHSFVIKEAYYTKLCTAKNILTVNGQFPGPTLHIHQGDTAIVDVHNKGNENITIHWHGVKQPRNPWSDGPEYITQCPIMPGKSFTQKIEFSDEIGTLWWHAHSDWSRATVHGALIIYPKKGDKYPFPKPHAEVPIIIGEWWKSDIKAVLNEFKLNGGNPNRSDAHLINGQPGNLYPCTKQDTYKLAVDQGKVYLLRVVNSVMDNIQFFSIAKHQVRIVGSDGSYTKPVKSDYIAISPGQTIDLLLEANQAPDHYYMAAKPYSTGPVAFNITTTGIIQYRGNYTPSPQPSLPILPASNDTNATSSFMGSLKSLASKVKVPLKVDAKLFFTFSINTLPCERNNICDGPGRDRLAASVNNISFVNPQIDILQAYYLGLKGVYGDRFPSFPPFEFNFTGNILPSALQTPRRGTEVRVLQYDSNVEIVFQGTNLGNLGIVHPIHLHGHSFYVVGWGFGNFDEEKDPLHYNLVDPPLMNTIAVPKDGWTTIRFKANNPGVWLMHCHSERHVTWGMQMVFIVKNGRRPGEELLPPPPDLPKC